MDLPQFFGLYKHRTCSTYDDGDGSSTHSSEHLVGVDTTEEALRNRWNAARDAEREQLVAENAHASYINRVEPNLPEGTASISYSGSTSGGYASVRYTLCIKPIPQFDEVKS